MLLVICLDTVPPLCVLSRLLLFVIVFIAAVYVFDIIKKISRIVLVIYDLAENIF